MYPVFYKINAKYSYNIYSVWHLDTKYNRKVSYLDSRNQIFMAERYK